MLLESSCFVADTSNPLIFSDSPALMKDESIWRGTLASPLYMYSTKDLTISKSMSDKKMVGLLFQYSPELNMPYFLN